MHEHKCTCTGTADHKRTGTPGSLSFVQEGTLCYYSKCGVSESEPHDYIKQDDLGSGVQNRKKKKTGSAHTEDKLL